MSARTLSKIVAIAFIIVGVLAVGSRYAARSAYKKALEDSLWRLTYDISFKTDGTEDEGSVDEVRVALPRPTSHVDVEAEEFSPDDLRTRTRLLNTGTRELVAFTRKGGEHRLTTKFDLKLCPSGTGTETDQLIDLDPDTRSRYLREESTLPIGKDSIRRIAQAAKSNSETIEGMLQWIFEYCSRDLGSAGGASSSDSVEGVLLNKQATPLGRARTMTTICRAAKLPTRMVAGFDLRRQEDFKPHIWVEVFRENRWVPYDPEFGYSRHMPVNFVAARRGGESIIRTSNNFDVTDLASKYSIVRLDPPQEVLEAELKRPTSILDLTRLPVGMHQTISLLLLLPLGALITAFFRIVIGIRTFGTFAPALFAISFIYADWMSGLLVLAIVLLMGFGGRSLIERMQLLMVPRLSIILTLIIMFVVLGVSLLAYIDATPNARAVLLPLVIITILIERFYVATEEDGAGFSLSLLLGTIFVSFCCYLMLRWDAIGDFILIYPEFHLITIAIFVLIGRYTGYRLMELRRFRDLIDESKDANR